MPLESEVLNASARTLSQLVSRGDISAQEVVEVFLRRVDSHRSGNAFITTCPDYALSVASRRPTGRLAGVPFAVKDMFLTRGVRTTYGSSLFRDHVPRLTAPAVKALEAEGAILIGKANQHEFAWGVTSQNPHWGTVRNPLRPNVVAGGSSGGNAAALADSLCTIGLGTDTGGSVRIPAACCDIVGFKPPFGAIPTRGMMPLAPSFDTVGPMARTVEDCALVYSILTGRQVPAPRLSGLRVGILKATGYEDEFSNLGADILEVSLPLPSIDPTPVFLAECALTHLPWFPQYRDQYGPDTRVKWDIAFRVTAVQYRQAQAALREFRKRARSDPKVDVILSPTLDMEPPLVNCWEPDVRAGMTRFTRTYNFLGWPALAVGSLQFAGRTDSTVLSAALAWELACAHRTSPSGKAT